MGIKERKEREKLERRQKILEAAKKLFMLKGYRSTTLEDIAKEVELSPATIYLYFRSKEELYVSLNLIGLQSLAGRISGQYKKLSVEKKILRLKDALYGAFRQDPLLFRVIFHTQLEDTLSSLDGVLLDELNQLARKNLNLMADVFAEGMRQGTFSESNCMALADIHWATFTGLVLWEEAKRKINPQ
jgi:AcrR family transcriptional regulator